MHILALKMIIISDINDFMLNNHLFDVVDDVIVGQRYTLLLFVRLRVVLTMYIAFTILTMYVVIPIVIISRNYVSD